MPNRQHGVKGQGPWRQRDRPGVGGLLSLLMHFPNSYIGITMHFSCLLEINTIICDVLMKGVTYSKQSIKC